MSGNIRGSSKLWEAAVLADGQTTDSQAANVGPQTNLALFVTVSGAVTLVVQGGMAKAPGAGRNQLQVGDDDSDDDVTWFDYIRAQVIETASGVEGNTAKLVFAGAGAICIDMSPFAPTFLRLTTVDGNGVTVTAYTVAVG